MSQKTPRVIAVTFGDQDYLIPHLRSKGSAQWRKALMDKISTLATEFGGLADFEQTDLNDMQQVSGLVQQFSKLLYGAPELLIDLICAYAPGLAREAVEASAYDEELIAAFVAIVQVAIPLDKLRTMFRGLSGTSTS
jgi:hypothetical protein